jgi:hypothetical protein
MARERAGRDRRVLSDLWFPLFDELADPSAIVLLSAEAEEAGWHGVFVWDHLRWRAPVRQVADPWITLAGIASATEQVRISPMVTPLPRRRPHRLSLEYGASLVVDGPGIGIRSHRGIELGRPQQWSQWTAQTPTGPLPPIHGRLSRLTD